MEYVGKHDTNLHFGVPKNFLHMCQILMQPNTLHIQAHAEICSS